MLAHDPDAGLWSRTWNRNAIDGVCRVLALWLGGAVDAVRAGHGLAALRQSPLFILAARPALALYPPWFATDTAPGLITTGFVRAPPGEIDADLADWLCAGPPPLVFTLGSLCGAAPGGFQAAALATARTLGRRAVLLAPDAPHREPGLITRAHIDYGALFPHAAAIIHHGGVGTIAAALAADKPQLIVPHLGDQFDNAARVSRLGIGRALDRRKFGKGAAVAALDDLLANTAVAQLTARFGSAVRMQDGAIAAAETILAMPPHAPAPASLPRPDILPIPTRLRSAIGNMR